MTPMFPGSCLLLSLIVTLKVGVYIYNINVCDSTPLHTPFFRKEKIHFFFECLLPGKIIKNPALHIGPYMCFFSLLLEN
jgi:hypothetical protein